ncbi:MAG: hypothetical protein V3R93_06945 [Candidatus Hydrothermarchaeaceae archaeon]
MKNKKKSKTDYSFLFKELTRLKPELEYNKHPITTSELDEIDEMRKAVIEATQKQYRYCSST